MSAPLLEAQGVAKTYVAGGRTLPAVDGVSLRLRRGETLGLVGESGCGKSTLGRCLVRLQRPTRGTIRFDGRDITDLSLRALRPLRPRLQMVFQDSTGALNPRRRVGDLIAEPLRVHRAPGGGWRSPAEVADRVAELAVLVGLIPGQLDRFPHEFSGGQRQRIGIARALALEPELVVADEPVSALDVSVQAQVVNLMMDLQDRLGLTTLFIAHDLAVIRQVAARVAVMYRGAIVETGPTAEIFARPAHPYTAALLAAVPQLRPASRHASWQPVPGGMPDRAGQVSGCRFHPLCPRARPRCLDERPALAMAGAGREAACHFPLGI